MPTPKLRFKEFDGDWSQVKLKDLVLSLDAGVSVNGEDVSVTEDDFSVLKTSCVSLGTFNPDERKKVTLEHEILRLKEPLLNNSLVMNRSNTPLLVASSAFIRNAPKKTYLSDKLWQFKVNQNANIQWIAFHLSNETTLIKLRDMATGTSNSMKNITKPDVLNFDLIAPSKSEQTKIASFLSAVDEKISQLTQKHALLSQYKQGMMQKLFSQQIRFKADDGSEFGEWESRSLGEVGENIIGLTYSPTDVTNDGSGILVLRSSNIKNGRLDKSDQVRVNKKIKDKIIVQANDILICTRNGSQRLIGKSVIINDDEEMTFGAFMSVYRSEYNRFIAYLMQTPWFFEQVQMNLGARINQITTGTLNEFTFDFPCLEEQTKIANFLSAIDQKIEVVAQQIEQAKTWKKGLLQQMFV
ncbi:restriction endonuclease subunit S [Acinetobacter johnsonii]|nr:restriction endonuclease subunit S [Acinetobacter johnsonii]MDH1241346.1 restriction endonuclease subunit S [Acinetobacter johnsonii]QQV08257.1 restriction endonuclease subunit S [Acinetobacter johnsonii]